jgi:cell division GTPase FtsZ
VLDEKMQDEMKITVIATGFDRAGEMTADKVQPLPTARQTPNASAHTRTLCFTFQHRR